VATDLPDPPEVELDDIQAEEIPDTPSTETDEERATLEDPQREFATSSSVRQHKVETTWHRVYFVVREWRDRSNALLVPAAVLPTFVSLYLAFVAGVDPTKRLLGIPIRTTLVAGMILCVAGALTKLAYLAWLWVADGRVPTTRGLIERLCEDADRTPGDHRAPWGKARYGRLACVLVAGLVVVGLLVLAWLYLVGRATGRVAHA